MSVFVIYLAPLSIKMCTTFVLQHKDLDSMDIELQSDKQLQLENTSYEKMNPFSQAHPISSAIHISYFVEYIQHSFIPVSKLDLIFAQRDPYSSFRNNAQMIVVGIKLIKGCM